MFPVMSQACRLGIVAVLVVAMLGCQSQQPTDHATIAATQRRSEPRMEGREPVSVIEIKPQEAKTLLEGGGYVYLDVRTAAEFVAGHPPAALNIPVAQIDPATGQMQINADFLDVVKANIAANTQLIVGCKMGGRSSMACDILVQAGYTDVRNMDGGFSGTSTATGEIVDEGWSTLGYPIERGDGSAGSYSSLSQAVKP